MVANNPLQMTKQRFASIRGPTPRVKWSSTLQLTAYYPLQLPKFEPVIDICGISFVVTFMPIVANS